MSIYEKLLNIQTNLKAPKNQINDFGNYKYRSCEDILEALKPLCKENKISLIIYDDIVLIGDRYYIKATAELIDCESSEKIHSVAYARESLTKKGMDESQITGATSSYARKYALNGLFNIDDTKDSDTNNYQKVIKKSQDKELNDLVKNEFPEEKINNSQIKVLKALITKLNKEEKAFLNYLQVEKYEDITKEQYGNALKMLNNTIEGKK